MVFRHTTRRPLIVAHRGSSALAPENTLAAISLAIDKGADMIEVDVRLTRDFFLVVHHDRNVRRTTNGKGNIWDLTLDELRRLDAGSWFSPRFGRERIPTLRQVMELLPDHVTINIEMKTDGDPRTRIALEEASILAVLEKRFEDRAIISSFDHKFLKRVHSLYPAITTGALYVPVRDARKSPSRLARNLGVHAFICSRTQVRPRLVVDAHEHDLIVGCYTINTAAHLEAMLALNVDAIITDNPGKIAGMVR